MGRTCDRCAHAHALRLLATHSRHSPLDFGQSRSPRNGDIDTLTVHEYLALSRWRRLCYRVYRHPIIMFGLGPAICSLFYIWLPFGLMRAGWQPWLSAMATNVAIAALVAIMIWLVGVVPFLLVHLPIRLLAARSVSGCSMSSTNSRIPNGLVTASGSCTKWRFTVAHIRTCRASCAGPPPNMVFITSISCSRDLTTDCHPSARLSATGRHRSTYVSPEFQGVRLVLWDEDQQRLVSFQEVRQRYAPI